MCAPFDKSRQAWYKGRKAEEAEDFVGRILVGEIQRVRKKLPGVGVEKLHHLLAEKGVYARWSVKMGRDKLGELMAANGLLAKKKSGRARTTNSLHSYRKYPNLLKNMEITGKNQAWVSDITYVAVGGGFSYLSLVTDAHSRKIVGWHLGRDLRAQGCLRALGMAVADCKKPPGGLIHHSDRGVQYCCHDYVRLLKKHGIGLSMTVNGDPYENALAERVNRTIKEEMLQGRAFFTHRDAEQAVAEAIAAYNEERPHASLDFKTPKSVHNSGAANLKKRWSKRRFVSKQTTTTTIPSAAENGNLAGISTRQSQYF